VADSGGVPGGHRRWFGRPGRHRSWCWPVAPVGVHLQPVWRARADGPGDRGRRPGRERRVDSLAARGRAELRIGTMKARTWIGWLVTGLMAALMLLSAVPDVLRIPDALIVLRHRGYPPVLLPLPA